MRTWPLQPQSSKVLQADARGQGDSTQKCQEGSTCGTRFWNLDFPISYLNSILQAPKIFMCIFNNMVSNSVTFIRPRHMHRHTGESAKPERVAHVLSQEQMFFNLKNLQGFEKAISSLRIFQPAFFIPLFGLNTPFPTRLLPGDTS